MSQALLQADFTARNGSVKKRLHSSNSAPVISTRNIFDASDLFRQLHFTESRTHDWALWNAGERMVDTHFIFPLMHLDSSDPANYVFGPTDEALALCRSVGTNIYYRLGTSIEHAKGRHFNAIMPEDFHKYAEVLAGIVRHYTRGWANGFHWDIQSWEIWNEADLGEQMWSGTQEQFNEFFAIVLKRLKSEFPELKIGGPGFCWYEEKKFAGLLDACKKADVVPDFISSHCYTSKVENILAIPQTVRALLDAKGFPDTEFHLNEWHFIKTWEGLHHNVTPEGFRSGIEGRESLHGIDSGCFNLNVLTGFHDRPIDAAYFYGAGIYGNWGFQTIYKALDKNFFSMKLFGGIVSKYTKRIRTTGGDVNLSLFGAVADDASNGVLLLSDFRGSETEFQIEIKGMENAEISAVILDDSHDLTPADAVCENGILTLRKYEPGSAAFLVSFQKR